LPYLLSFPTRRSSDLYILDVELVPKITHAGVFPFERERRSAGHDAQPIDLCQCVENLFAYAVAEILLVLCLAKIEEWQHSHAFRSEEHTSELQSRFDL